MLPIKKILCPTDFSEPSYEALKVADELGRHFSAGIWLVHVVSTGLIIPAAPSTFNVPVYQMEMVESAKKALNDLVKDKFSGSLTVQPFVLEGSPPEQIVKFAEDSQVDLIVIATHGQTGWRRFIFGSVAEKVVRLASCPVLTVQCKPKEEGS